MREPVAGPDRFRNKLRAFEVRRFHDRFLLLDADIVLLRPIQEVASRLKPDVMELGYANIPHLSIAQWRSLFWQLGMEPPSERVAMAEAGLGAPTLNRGHGNEIAATLPYFNSGVVSAPWNFDLGEQWERLIDEVPRIVLQVGGKENVPHHALYDQPPLAVAVEALRRQGKSKHILADSLHARWQHFCRGSVTFDDAMVVHNTGIFKPSATPDLREGVRGYIKRSRSRMARRRPTPAQLARLNDYADRLGNYLLLLSEKWIKTGG